jgi:hypothetical protein
MSERKSAVINNGQLLLKMLQEVWKQQRERGIVELSGTPKVKLYTDGYFQVFDAETDLPLFEGELGFPLPDTELTAEGMTLALKFDRRLREEGLKT